MERKNTILLTVIAIATLLVAVVGATFAYFTAQFTTQNDTQNSVTVQPTTVASVTFDYGSKVTVTPPVYPGYQIVKEMHVTGDGDGDAKAASIKLALSGSIDENMAADEHVKVTLYKGNTTGQVTFESKPVTETASGTTKYYDAGELKTNSASSVKVFDTSHVAINDEYIINDITGSTNDYYFLVIEYVNDDQKPQDDEKTESFTVTISASAVDVNAPGA